MKRFKWLLIMLILVLGVTAGCTTDSNTSIEEPAKEEVSSSEPESQEEVSIEESEPVEEESDQEAGEAESEGEEATEQEEVTTEEEPESQEESSNKEGTDEEASASDGKVILDTSCTECHGLGKVQSAKKDRDDWENTVNRMISKGASVSEDDKTTLIEYLAENYGK